MRDSVKSLEVGYAPFTDDEFAPPPKATPVTKGTSRQLVWGSVIVTIPSTQQP